MTRHIFIVMRETSNVENTMRLFSIFKQDFHLHTNRTKTLVVAPFRGTRMFKLKGNGPPKSKF